jgi:hypothetical protein
MISTKLEVQYAMECSHCDNRIDVVAPMNKSKTALTDLRKKVEASAWEELKLGKRSVGLICPVCVKTMYEEDEDDNAETSETEETQKEPEQVGKVVSLTAKG